MNLAYCGQQLAANAVAIEKLVEPVAPEQACWKPAEDEWSVLEVLYHLLDEERKDFPFRLRHLVSGSGELWPAIAPAQWVAERECDSRDLGPTLRAFLHERQASLEWLTTLSGGNWTIAYAHPPLEDLSAGQLLVSWVSHDLLHMKQLVELKFAYGRTQFGVFGPEYAGQW